MTARISDDVVTAAYVGYWATDGLNPLEWDEGSQQRGKLAIRNALEAALQHRIELDRPEKAPVGHTRPIYTPRPDPFAKEQAKHRQIEAVAQAAHTAHGGNGKLNGMFDFCMMEAYAFVAMMDAYNKEDSK